MMMELSRFLILMSLCWTVSSEAAPKSRKSRGRPNVLFIVADDLRDYVGWLGGHPQAQTPNMDHLARQGMRFTNAHCNFALCNPSRASLLTGMLPSSNGVFGNEQDWRRSVLVAGKKTLPEHFKSQGYRTAAAGKIFHANHGGPENRLAGWHGGRRGFELDQAWDVRFPAAGIQIPALPVPTGQNFNGLDIWHWDWGKIAVPEAETDDGLVTAWTADFLKQKSSKPFFLAVGLYRPHSPWYVPQKYFDQFPLDEILLPTVKEDDLADLPPMARQHVKPGNHHEEIIKNHQWKAAVQAYLACVAFCDARLGEVLAALEAGPNAANTMVVFTSDHGWYLGEKQMWHKGRLWEVATRVPLTIYAPGVTSPDTVCEQPVSLVDLYPTLCELSQLTKPTHLDGESLLPQLTKPRTPRARPAITAMGGGDKVSYAARTDQWRYIRYADGSEELYDHQADPHEWTNLANKPEYALLKQDIAAHLPVEFQRASRPVSEIASAPSPDGSVHLKLEVGDVLEALESPPLTGRGFFIETAFAYNAEVDRDSTLVSHGDSSLGYVLHLLAGQPTLTVFDQGKATSIIGEVLANGACHLRAGMDADGLMSLAVPGVFEVLGLAPFLSGFPAEPTVGLAAGQSFGPLKAKDYPNSTPFDGAVQRLRITLMPPKEK